MRRLSHVVMILALMLLLAAPALAQSADLDAALAWLQDQQLDDGGFSDGFSDGSGAGPTAEVVYAAVATGQDISTWGSPSPLAYLAQQASDMSDTGVLAKTALAATATGQDPSDFGGTDLPAALRANYDADAGSFAGTIASHAYAMLALHNAGESMPAGATDTLIDLQAEDGGWSFDGASQSETNTTALAIQALVAAGEPMDGDAIGSALEFLRTQQNEDGGFPYQTPSDVGTETDANSTAWVIQALLALDQDLADWNDPQETLATFQLENGAFQWQSEVPGENFLATAQAVPALAGVTYVDLPVVEAAQAPAATPETLPETGQPAQKRPIGAMLAGAGIVIVGAGVVLRRKRG